MFQETACRLNAILLWDLKTSLSFIHLDCVENKNTEYFEWKKRFKSMNSLGVYIRKITFAYEFAFDSNEKNQDRLG